MQTVEELELHIEDGNIVSVEEFVAFRERVLRVRTILRNQGHGAQQRAAYACEIGPSRISNLLKAKNYDLPALEVLEVYVQQFEREAVTA